MHLQLTRPFGLQLADRRREITGQDGRVRPARFGERVRCDVLGRLIQGHADRVGAPLFDCPPVAGEDLVGPPAEQERVGALVGLVDERQGLAVEHPHGPSAALESAPAVFIRRAAVSLHHSIDGDLRHGRQFHDRGSLLLQGAPRGRPLTPATNTPVPIRHRLADFFRELRCRACRGRTSAGGGLRLTSLLLVRLVWSRISRRSPLRGSNGSGWDRRPRSGVQPRTGSCWPAPTATGPRGCGV